MIFSLSALLLLVLSCSRGTDGSSQPGQTPVHPAIAVETAIAEPRTLIEGIEVTGTIAPKFEVDVKSEVTGLVSKVYVTEWIRVKRGAPLARIDSREQDAIAKRAEAALESAKASHLQARVAENRARRELERMKKLKEAGLATQQNLDDAATEAEAAESRVEAARAQVRAAEEDLNQARTRLSKCFITSPIDGIVSQRKVNPGDLVGETGIDRPLFHVVDNRVLNLTVSVPSSEMARLHPGQPLQFSTDALPDKNFTGKVMFINPAVNEADRSVKIIAEVINTSGELKGGLFVKGRIITGTRYSVVQAPRSSLLGWDMAGKKANIYVVEGEQARLRGVKTGNVSVDSVEITEGLKPGEHYILRGGFNVKDGDRLVIAGKQGN